MFKRALAVGAIALAAFLVPAFGAPKEASYHDQLMEMFYHMMHLSSINVINGLNLSREQALRLRDMAREVEKSGGYVPPMNAPLPGELAEVRKTYVELAQVLARGEEVSDDLAKRVQTARTAEAKWVREGISERPTEKDKGVCTRCHMSPDRINELRATKPSGSKDETALSGSGYYTTPKMKTETDQAHVEGELGKGAAAKVRDLAPKVDELLTDAQKDVLGSFSCCLIPPKNLSDPVRVGQAAVTDGKLKLLRQVRQVPEGMWAQGKDKLIDKLLDMVAVKKAGVSEQALDDYRAHLGRTFDEVRRLSDTEFEMKKETLCAQLDLRAVKPADPGKQRTFKQAYFLLMPGSAKVYDVLLGRMAKAR